MWIGRTALNVQYGLLELGRLGEVDLIHIRAGSLHEIPHRFELPVPRREVQRVRAFVRCCQARARSLERSELRYVPVPCSAHNLGKVAIEPCHEVLPTRGG